MEAGLRFVLIDKLLALEPGRRAVASASFADAHDVLADHFPGRPVVPGVLLTEAMGQTGGWLVASTLGFERWPLLVMIERAKFRRLVAPDEMLRLEARLRSRHSDVFEVDADARAGGRVVASARLVFHLFDLSMGESDRERFDTWARGVFQDIGGPRLLAS